MNIEELRQKTQILTIGREWKLLYVNKDATDSWGITKSSPGTIALADKMKPRNFLNTYFHEIGHVFVDECDIKLDMDLEVFCNLFALFMKEFTLQNGIIKIGAHSNPDV